MASGNAQALFAVGAGGGRGFNQIQSVAQPQSLADYSPEVQAELARQERRRQIANMLVQQGLAGRPATTPAGRFIVPSGWAGGVADLAKVAAGMYGNVLADRAGKDAIDEENKKYAEAIQGYQQRIADRPAQPEQFVGSQEAPGGESMPAQPVTSASKQQAILEALMQSRIPAVQRYGLMQQSALEGERAREDTQSARAHEQTLAREQRTAELGIRTKEAEAAREMQDRREAAAQAETARHNKEMELLAGDANKKQAEVERHNRAMEVIQSKAAGNKPLTEAQANANIYATRAEEADHLLDELGDSYSPMLINRKIGAGKVPVIGGLLEEGANVALGKNEQKAEQAMRNFINAVLRKESGAVISPEEFDNARKQYFRQPGDSPEVIEQKKENRRIVIEGLRTAAGPAYKPKASAQPYAERPVPARPTQPLTPAQKQAYDKTQIDALLEKYK